MLKQEFLSELRARLNVLPEEEREEHLNYYAEMIDDRVEEGCLEETAVSEIGSAEEIAEQILRERPLMSFAPAQNQRAGRTSVWLILLLVLGFPVWGSLLIAAFSVLISLYAVLWSLVASAWCVFGAFAGCALGGILSGIVFAFVGKMPAGIAILGAGFVCAGLAVLTFFGCKLATKGSVRLSKTVISWMKNCFARKERLL